VNIATSMQMESAKKVNPTTLTYFVVGVVAIVFFPLLLSALMFDFDEVQHAHVIWLIGQGQRPFIDFCENHLPLAWYAFLPITSMLPEAPENLAWLRVFSLSINLAFIFFVLASACLRYEKNHRVWFVLAGALIFTASDNCVVSVQLRPDGLAHALLFGAVFMNRRDQNRSFIRSFKFALLAMICLLITPKFALFVIAYSLLDLVHDHWAKLKIAVQLAAYALGVLTATFVVALVLNSLSLSLIDSFRLSVEYHSYLNAYHSGQWGLLKLLLAQPALLLLIGLGMVLLCVEQRKEILQYEFELAIVIFVLSQVILVQFNWRQYSFPCFVVLSIFIAHIGLFVSSRWKKRAYLLQTLMLMGFCTSMIYIGVSLSSEQGSQQHHLTFLRELKNIKKAGGSVVIAPPLHPVSENDVFYNWLTFSDALEKIMANDMNLEVSERFTEGYYQREIERQAPALVILGNFPPVLGRVVNRYLRDHRNDYRRKVILLGRAAPIEVWVHRDFNR
jgi:hypothetical protein